MSAAIINQSFSIVSGSGGGDTDWCSNIRYTEVDMCYIRAYINRNRGLGCCLPPALYFGLSPQLCLKGTFPIPTDVGLPKSLPRLPLGFHYGQTNTDSTRGRARVGIWAKDQGNIYIVPWIQSTEKVLMAWEGIKRTWVDADPIDDDPLLHQAMIEYARWKHFDKWEKDEAEAARAKAAFEDARTMLIHQCREETRVRGCEPSHARSSPGQLFYNDEQSATATCPDGSTGNAITQIIPAGTVASNKSVADANAIAKQQAQEQATARLDCVATPTTYHNEARTGIASCARTEGAPEPDGNDVSITIPANTPSCDSLISQNDANAKAQALADSQASDGLSCTFWNSAQTASCPSGQTGSDVTVAAHTNSSTVSQEDADALALNEANNQLVCSGGDFWNTEQVNVPTLVSGCSGHPTCQVFVFVTVSAHRRHSSTSQADANQQARNLGSEYGTARAKQKCLLGQCGTYNFTL